MRPASLCLLRSGFPPGVGSRRPACDCGTVEPNRSAPIRTRSHLPDRICGSEGHSPDGAIRLRAASTVVKRVYRSQPIFRQESHTLYRFGQPRSRRRGSYSFRHQVERQCGVQLVTGRAAETHESRFAVSSLLHVLQVHVRQHWVLWSLGKCQQRVRVLAKCV